MSTFFFDSSGLIKRYVTETGSQWVRSIAAPASRNIIFIAHITPVEIASALARRKRDTSITTQIAQTARLRLDRHVRREYQTIILQDSII